MKKVIIALSILVYLISPLFPQETDTIFFDDFDSYITGEQLACQNPENWITWNDLPCTNEDPFITDTISFSGTNSLFIADSNNLVHPINNYTSGKYKINFRMYIPVGENGVFSILKLFDAEYSEVGVQMNFNSDGYLELENGSTGQQIEYNQGTWMKNEIFIDLDEDWCQYYLDDLLLIGWQWSLGIVPNNIYQLAGVNFKTDFWSIENAKYFIDDYYFEEIETVQLPPPENLSLTVVNNNITLNWDSPELGGWLNWDNGNNGNGIGTNGEPFYVASRFDTIDLSSYNGCYLSKIRFFAQSSTCTYSLRVWIGENAGTLLIAQDVTNFEPFSWNEILLDNPIQVDASQELWLGYVCTSQMGEFPASCDDGPAIPYKGDMISLDGVSWVSMSIDYGLDYNWNIEAYVSSNDILEGYNIYHSFNLSPFEMIGFTIENSYADEVLLTGEYGYNVTALYDEGESIASDTVSEYIITDINEAINDQTNVIIYPNPVKDVVYIISDMELQNISLFDARGHIKKEITEINQNKYKFSISGIKPGVYLLQLGYGDDIFIKRIIIL